MARRDKVVTIRMDEKLVRALDTRTRDFVYYSRSDLINAAVALITQPEFQPFMRDLLHFNPEWGGKIEKIDLKFTR